MRQKDHHQIHHKPKEQDHTIFIMEGRHQILVGHNQTANKARQCYRRKDAPEDRMLLAFRRRFRFQQLRHRDLFQIPQGNQHRQKKHAKTDGQRQQDSLCRIRGDGKGHLHDGSEQGHNELKDHQTRTHAHDQRKDGQQPRLTGEQRLDIPPGHAQRQVHAEFLFSQLQHEAGGVTEYQCCDQAGQDCDHSEHGAHIRRNLRQLPDPVAVAEVIDRKHQRDAQRHRDKIDQIIADLAANIPQGQFSEHLLHPPAPPWY